MGELVKHTCDECGKEFICEWTEEEHVENWKNYDDPFLAHFAACSDKCSEALKGLGVERD